MVSFAVILIVFFFVPVIRNDFFHINEKIKEENVINLTRDKDLGELIAHEKGGGVDGGGGGVYNGRGGDGQAKDAAPLDSRPRKGPPQAKDRKFHFVPPANEDGSTYREIELGNQSLHFSGPSNPRQVSPVLIGCTLVTRALQCVKPISRYCCWQRCIMETFCCFIDFDINSH